MANSGWQVKWDERMLWKRSMARDKTHAININREVQPCSFILTENPFEEKPRRAQHQKETLKSEAAAFLKTKAGYISGSSFQVHSSFLNRVVPTPPVLKLLVRLLFFYVTANMFSAR